jgi:hypothetical protein
LFLSPPPLPPPPPTPPHDRYVRWGKVSDRDCWRYAVLAHNFPYAADRLAFGLPIYLDPARQDEPAEWVIDATNGRLTTVREWCASYIEKATALVRW